MAEEANNNQEGGDKVAKQYDANFKKLVALMNGEKNMRKTKVPNNEIGQVVAELIKEKKDAAIKAFKDQAILLLDKKVEFDKEIKKLEDEFKNKVNGKKKEFTEEMQKLFKTVENIESIEKSYYASLGTAVNNEEQDEK